jgi:hypothetical protein
MGLFSSGLRGLLWFRSAKLKKLQGSWQKTKKKEFKTRNKMKGQLYFAFQLSLEVFRSSFI